MSQIITPYIECMSCWKPVKSIASLDKCTTGYCANKICYGQMAEYDKTKIKEVEGYVTGKGKYYKSQVVVKARKYYTGNCRKILRKLKSRKIYETKLKEI